MVGESSMGDACLKSIGTTALIGLETCLTIGSTLNETYM